MAKIIDALALRLGFVRPARRDFAASAFTRLTAGWNSTNTSANVDLFRGLDTLRARSRDLCANNDYGRRFLGMVGANVVGGTGVILQARIYDKPGQPDEGANGAIETAWAKWGARGSCDVTGRLSWRDVQMMVIRAVARDGEVLVRKIIGKSAGNGVGYALQVLDIDRLDTRLVRAAEKGVNEIRMGVEINEFGRPLAYWLRPSHPGDLFIAQGEARSEHIRVPADQILHIYMPDRPEQLRGAPWMHAAMTRLKNLGGYEEAAVIAARVGASKMGFFTTPDGDPTPLGEGTDADGVPYTEADPGQFGVLPTGVEFTPFNPDYPHAMYDMFIKACLRGISSGLGVAYHSLANDLEGVNFSSIRAGTLEERDQWISIQQWFIDAFCEPVYADWIGRALAMGQVLLANGATLPIEKREKFAAHEWQGRRWQWVDPVKDIEAARLAVKSGVASPQMIAAQAGVDIEDVLSGIASFEARIARDKLTLIDYDLKAAPPAETPPPDPALAEAAKQIEALTRQVLSLEARAAVPAPAPQQIHYHAGYTHVAPAEVRNEITVPPSNPTPVEIRNEITTPEQPAPNVEVRVEAVMPEQAAPEVEVVVNMPEELRMAVTSLPTRATTSSVTRDQNGNITRTTQTETDA